MRLGPLLIKWKPQGKSEWEVQTFADGRMRGYTTQMPKAYAVREAKARIFDKGMERVQAINVRTGEVAWHMTDPSA